MIKNMVNKAFDVVLLFSLFVILTGCLPGNADYSNIIGYPEVAEAKKLYEELDSGHFYMIDNTSGRITEEFTFKYRDDGQLTYLYKGTDGDNVYFEYHNGSEINYKKSVADEWKFVSKGDPDYYSYSRKDKHPYTVSGVISVNAYAVTESDVQDTENGGKKVSFKYNAEYLASSLSELGELKSFESSVWLNKDGYCYRLDQKGIFEKDGEFISDFSMYIDMMNEVESVERDANAA